MRRRRHGRLRRWVVRPLFWALAVATIATAALVVYLESDSFARLARARGLEWLELRLEREISVGALDLDLLPLRLVADDVRIAGASEESAPFLTAERVIIDATVGSFLRPGIVLDLVVVQGPRITVGWDETGVHDAPSWRRRANRARSGRLVDVEIDLIEVRDGSIDLGDRRLPLDLVARDLSASLNGGAELGELRGRIAASAVEVTLPRGRPYLGEVSVDGSYRPGRVDVRQARITGPDLVARLSGVWRWRELRDLDFKIVADSRLGLLDRLGIARDLGDGPVRFEGTLRRMPQEWFLSGAVESPGLVVFDRRLVAVTGRVFSDREDLRIEIDESRYGGGSLTGTVTVPYSAPKPIGVALKLEAVDLGRLLADQQIPVAGLAGAVSGVVDYQFVRADPRRGDGWAELMIRPKAPSPRPDGRLELVVEGAAPLSIGNGTIRSEAIRLASARQLLTAGGSYDLGAAGGSFDYVIVTRDPSELMALLPLSGEPQAWQPRSGSGTIEGRLDLGSSGTRSVLRLDLEDIAASGYTAERLMGGLTVSATAVEDLRLELTRVGGAMLVAGNVPITNDGRPLPFGLAVDAVGWPLEDVAVWLPWDPPAGGDFSGSLELEGSLEAPRGRVEGDLAPLRTGIGDFERLSLVVAFTPERADLESARLQAGDGTLDVIGTVALADGELDLELHSEAVRLEALPLARELAGGLTGSAEIRAALRGTLVAPRLDGSVVIGAVAAGARAVPVADGGRVRLSWDGRRLDLDGSLDGVLTLAGGGALTWEDADLEFAVESDDLGLLLGLLAGAEEQLFEGSGVGRLTMQGPLSPAPALVSKLVAPIVELRRGDVTLVNLEPIELGLGSSRIEVRSLFLGDEGATSELFVRGTVESGAAASVDLDVQASLRGEWLSPWLAGVEVSDGTLDLIGEITGSPTAPRFNGIGEARGARVVVAGYTGVFEDVGAVVLLYPKRVVIESGEARVAGGQLQVAGAIDLGGAGGHSSRFQVLGSDLGLRYPEGWLVRSDAELTLASTATGWQVSGGLSVDRAIYTRDVPLEIDELLSVLFERRRIEAGDIEPWRSETALNLEIETEEGLRIRNNLADLTGRAELVLRGSLARPVVFGEVELAPGGRLVYRGQEFSLERGGLTFANPYRLEPVIDLVAVTEMREYDVTLSLAGTLDRLHADFVSEPPLPELEVLALLTGGRDPRKVAPDPGDTEASVAADSFLYGQATSLITGRFNRLFGLDQFRIDPLTSSTGDLSSARVTVGKRLSRDLFATYSYDPVQTDEQILELEWHISRSLVLVLTQNGDGTYAVDARWEKAL